MTFPMSFRVGMSSIEDYDIESDDDILRDPRGLLMMWEPPDGKSRYVMGMDTAEGITGWTRASRFDGDDKKDNSAIIIYKVDGAFDLAWKEVPNPNGKGSLQVEDIDQRTGKQRRIWKDVQVAEFAAPCDPVEAARVAYVLGNLYANKDEEQCELIWEAWPGCGLLASQELLRIGYANPWYWEYIDSVAEATDRLGWRSTRESQKILWYRSRRHIMEGRVEVTSRWLKSEYSTAEINMDNMRARAKHGKHDDRFMASNLALWASHKWQYDEPVDQPVGVGPVIDYQRYAPTLDGEFESFEDWKSRMVDSWGV